MTVKGQNEQILPTWVRDMVILVITIIIQVVAIVTYVADIKTDVAVLQSELDNLKQIYQRDVLDIKETMQKIDDKLKN